MQDVQSNPRVKDCFSVGLVEYLAGFVYYMNNREVALYGVKAGYNNFSGVDYDLKGPMH